MDAVERPRRWKGRLTGGTGGSDETVTAPSHGFDEDRSFRRVTERLPQPFHRCVEALIEIDVRVGGPERCPKFFTKDYFPGAPQQERKYLGGLARKAHPPALLEEFSRSRVEFENPEPNHRAGKR
jgi:hypothetical protein